MIYFVTNPTAYGCFLSMETFTKAEAKTVVKAAMSILGSRKSKKKTAAAQVNGKLGGRPKNKASRA